MKPPKVRTILLVSLSGLLFLETALLAGLLVRRSWQRSVSESPVLRGQRVAERAGCFGCHGPGGVRGIPNPGSKTGEVPSWTGGTWMMWNDREEDIRGWIEDGHPPGREPDPGALVKMPAYEGILPEREIEDLVAYVLAVSQFGWPEDERVAEGRDVAVRFGCLGCHGPEGRGLLPNPRSYKGYVAPWDGPDFEELVRDEQEFRQWVRQGISDRFKANPAARFFLERAPVKMPAYGDRISDSELDALFAYVRWVRDNPRGSRGKRAPRGGDDGGAKEGDP
jgi:mono/diheme cytochrome c family protein